MDVGRLDVLWWRRVQTEQQLPWPLKDPAQVDLVNKDCSAALVGSLLTRFQGAWVNDPVRGLYAENKLVQLSAARACGLSVPRTLVSQRPEEIRAFCDANEATIVKPVMGTRQAPLLTRTVTERHLESDEALKVAPAIYQECVPGRRHVRAQCFGDRVMAVLITSDALDWRARLDSEMELWDMPDTLHHEVLGVLRALGLRMGVVDLKLTDDDECFWLEVNQQGQFLFLEGLTGAPLTDAFCRF